MWPQIAQVRLASVECGGKLELVARSNSSWYSFPLSVVGVNRQFQLLQTKGFIKMF